MARQLRHNVEGGWYHITTRGMGRREIFLEDRDREHFLELLQGLTERYGVVLHAYVLMENHYHLLIETPHANASRALQSIILTMGLQKSTSWEPQETCLDTDMRKSLFISSLFIEEQTGSRLDNRQCA